MIRGSRSHHSLLAKGAIGALLLCGVVALRPTGPEPTIFGIARFKDGDSGHVGGTPIRLRCIDAAEYGMRAGRAAARFAWDRINGERLACTRRQESLSYGRVVVSCDFVTGAHRGRNLNRLLVGAGHAVYVSPACAAEASGW